MKYCGKVGLDSLRVRVEVPEPSAGQAGVEAGVWCVCSGGAHALSPRGDAGGELDRRGRGKVGEEVCAREYESTSERAKGWLVSGTRA